MEPLEGTQSEDVRQQRKNTIPTVLGHPGGGGLLDCHWLLESRVADGPGSLAGAAGKLPYLQH